MLNVIAFPPMGLSSFNNPANSILDHSCLLLFTMPRLMFLSLPFMVKFGYSDAREKMYSQLMISQIQSLSQTIIISYFFFLYILTLVISNYWNLEVNFLVPENLLRDSSSLR